MTEKKNPLGPTGETVRENIKALRSHRNLKFAELSRKCAEAGRPIPALGLRRIEQGTRRVDADDLVALALALDVSPATLLMPRTSEPDSKHQITDSTGATADAIWGWMTGRFNIRDGQAYPADMLWIFDSRPGWATRVSIDDITGTRNGNN